jgi:Fe-S-cluster-containing hydrogenase component 2
MEAISLVEDIAVIDEKKCIGCGVCSYHCPVSAIKLESTGIRDVFVPPARRSA